LKPLFRAGGLGRGLVQIVDEPERWLISENVKNMYEKSNRAAAPTSSGRRWTAFQVRSQTLIGLALMGSSTKKR